MDIVLADSATSWEVTSLVETPLASLFRHVINLSFNTGGYADSIKVNSETSAIEGVFTPQEYDALDAASPIHATKVGAPDRTVIISLDAPRKIKKIRIKQIMYADYSEAELAIKEGKFNHQYGMTSRKYSTRAVGSTPQPPVKMNAMMADAYADYQVGKSWGLDVDKIEIYRVDGDAIADEPTCTVGNNDEIEDFVSARFAVKVTDESKNYANLETKHVLEVIVHSNPTGPRIGIAAPVLEGETHDVFEYFWNVPGEIANQADTVPIGKNPNEELSKALTRYLNGRFNTIFDDAEDNEQLPDIPDNINVDLVLESDTPCVFDATQFKINYTLVRQRSSLPYKGVTLQEKAVVRFSGNALTTEAVTIEIPKNVEVITANLKTEASLGGKPSYVVGNMQPLTASHRTGINIAEDRWIAQSVSPDKAIRINGLALGLMNLEKETELLVELHEDWNGQPSGKKLFEAKIQLKILGERIWSRIPLRDSIPLATQSYWILLKSAKGTALWFTRNGGVEPVQVLQAAKEKTPLKKINALNGVETYYTFFSCCTHGQVKQAPFELTIDNAIVPPKTIEKDTISFELKDVLNTKLGRAEGEGIDSVTLLLSSAFSGLVTVYPPRIEYTTNVA
ncbi:MAG: hypothetical protein JW786_06470 [Desulfobacterales bacterium]|nr:hypothetical protein [Desulfobacterales bacterium]